MASAPRQGWIAAQPYHPVRFVTVMVAASGSQPASLGYSPCTPRRSSVSARFPRSTALLPWVVGMASAAVVLGPALRSGPLLNLDLVITPRIPVPRGVWALGPALPRRIPLGVPLAWVSTAIGGGAAMAMLLAGCLTVAFVGAWHLADHTPALCRLGAGLLYALNPFVLTRVGVGHWMLVASIAVLPWALPHLLRPSDDLGRTFLWSAALGATGINGGLFAASLVTIGLVAERGRRGGAVLVLLVAAQLPWLVPGAVILASSPRLEDPSFFATNVVGLPGPLQLVVGGGFWRQPSQVGAVTGVGAGLLAIGLIGLVLLGARRLPGRWGGRASALAALGLVVALASAVPGLRLLYAHVTGTLLGGALREGQRFLALFLVWLAPAVATGAVGVARGATRWAERAIWAVPAVVALALAGPGLWGVAGALRPVSYPSGWYEARLAVAGEPGTTLALPWHQYLDISFAGDRRVYNPIPDFFGGDVLSSSDAELGPSSEGGVDPREPELRRALVQITLGRWQSSALAHLGVRWVVLAHEVDWKSYRPLADDPGFEHVVATPSLDLFRVRTWPGRFVNDHGQSVPGDVVANPLAWVDRGATVWNRPAAPGWLRGTASAAQTRSGLLRLPEGHGPIWYWPAAMTMVTDALVIGGVLLAVGRTRSRKGRRRRAPPGESRRTLRQ